MPSRVSPGWTVCSTRPRSAGGGSVGVGAESGGRVGMGVWVGGRADAVASVVGAGVAGLLTISPVQEISSTDVRQRTMLGTTRENVCLLILGCLAGIGEASEIHLKVSSTILTRKLDEEQGESENSDNQNQMSSRGKLAHASRLAWSISSADGAGPRSAHNPRSDFSGRRGSDRSRSASGYSVQVIRFHFTPGRIDGQAVMRGLAFWTQSGYNGR
jgi:hypothetical protein